MRALIFLFLSACGVHNIIGAVAGVGMGAWQGSAAMKKFEREQAIERCAPENRVPADDEWCKGRRF